MPNQHRMSDNAKIHLNLLMWYQKPEHTLRLWGSFNNMLTKWDVGACQN